MKIKKFGGGGGGGQVRVDVIEELKFLYKKKISGGGVFFFGGGGQGECEQKFEVFVKMQKKIRGEGGGAFWVGSDLGGGGPGG